MYRWFRFLRRLDDLRCIAIAGTTAFAAGFTVHALAVRAYSISISNTSKHGKSIPIEDIVIDTKMNVHLDHEPTKRELKFLDFASVEYDDVIYMTPRDFLDSLVLDMPRERVYRRVLSKETVNRILSRTPSFRKGSRSLFREIDQQGIISYSDYLFLITILTKSGRALRIAFALFDRDDNDKIEKDEFLLIRTLVAIPRSSRALEETRESCSINTPDLYYLMRKLGLQARSKTDFTYEKSDEEVNLQDTTLLLHLFGRYGKEMRSFEEIERFRDNLQKELMELEFNEFSHGRNEISPLDFARLVLQYSTLRKSEYNKYIARVRERCTVDEQGVTFAEYELFSLFLNNLKEFTAAVRLYALAEIPISRKEFIRAVKASTGHVLNDHLVDLLYRIFDTNNDDRLSYGEFIAVMNSRVRRGFKGNLASFGWEPFKRCVRAQLGNF